MILGKVILETVRLRLLGLKIKMSFDSFDAADIWKFNFWDKPGFGD